MIVFICDVYGRERDGKEKFYSMRVDGKLVDMCPECAQKE